MSEDSILAYTVAQRSVVCILYSVYPLDCDRSNYQTFITHASQRIESERCGDFGEQGE